MQNNKHKLPYELEDMPEDAPFGDTVPLSDSEADSFDQYDTFLEGSDLYLGDGKNVYQVRKRLLGDNEQVLTADCVGVCNPDEYDMIMENEDGFGSVVGYVESDFAFYTEEDRFVPSPAETASQTSSDPGSNAAASAIRKAWED